MSKQPPDIPADKLALYDKLVAGHPHAERKGASIPYTSVNGHMFSFLTKEGTLALRLSDEMRDAFVKKYKTKPVVQYGAVMKEYVAVPASLLKKTRELATHFEASFDYVSGLKPKPTKKPTATKRPAKKKKK